MLEILSVALRLGAVVGIAFALVPALLGSPSPPWLAVAGQIARGAWLGALSGLGMLLALAPASATRWRESPSSSANGLAAALVTLWTALAMLHRLPMTNPLSGLLAVEGAGVVAAVGALFLLLVAWRALGLALGRVSACPPTGESFLLGLVAALLVEGGFALRTQWGSLGTLARLSLSLGLVASAAGAGTLGVWLVAMGRRWAARRFPPLREVRLFAWALLATTALASVLPVPLRRQEARTGTPQEDPFLRSPGLGDRVLVKLGPEVRAVVEAPCPSDLEYPVGGARRVELAWGMGASPRKATARYRAALRTADGGESGLLEEEVASARGEGPKWFSRMIDLPPTTGGATVVLTTRGTSQASFWAAPVFSGRGDPTRRNVIVVSLDTVRADHLNAYGYERRRTSPEIDAWAAEGTLFENASSASPGTLSSQMSILTGRYPSGHGVSYANWRRSGRIPVLPASVPTIAEVLGPRGFLTAAFTGSGYFALPIGYSRGFGEFVSTHDETMGGAASVFGKAFAWLDRHRDDPFFLFLHTYEAHEPYLDQRFVYEEGIGPQDPKARNEALYDGDICRADAYVGALRRRLDRLGLADRTLVVIVSDHGEEFGDHFSVWNDGHGHSLYDEQIHVPFVAVGPSVPRGRRFEQAVDLTSVAPTVLGFLAAEPPAGMDGRRLLGPAQDRGEAREGDWLAFSEDVWIGPETRAVRSRSWKLIEKGESLPERFLDSERRLTIHEEVGRLDPRMLFHLPSDPGERTNRLPDRMDVAASLRGPMNERLKPGARAGAAGEIRVEGEALERLRALGYVQ